MPMFSREILKTPVYKLNGEINGNAIYIKRDDLIPYSFGGNKTRKAFLFFEELLKGNFDCVVTYGSKSSNHVRVVANLAAQHHLKCFIVCPEEDTESSCNSQLTLLMGAEYQLCPVDDVEATIEKTLSDLKKIGLQPYFIPGGGHGDLGVQAYLEAYQEIKDYQRETSVTFDYIFLTSGTGTTQAGLVVGQVLAEDDVEIIGISNARKNPYGQSIILESVNNYLVQLGHKAVEKETVILCDDYVLDGYGSFNSEILTLIKKVLLNEGIPLDQVYTGKGFWGMEQYIHAQKITSKNILFIHTGGTPLFFDALEELKNVNTNQSLDFKLWNSK